MKKFGNRNGKYTIIYVATIAIFIVVFTVGIYFLQYYSAMSHFDKPVQGYYDPYYSENGKMIIDYKGKWYYVDEYTAANVTVDACRGDFSSRQKMLRIDEEELEGRDKIIIYFGEDATMTFYEMDRVGRKDIVYLVYECPNQKVGYYKIEGLEVFRNILENIRLVEK